jgi:HAD superfamily hydrolase (TIGR01509 family)
MTDKTAIIFDFGDVLVEWKFHNLYRKVFKDDAEIELFLEKTGLRDMNRRMDAGYPFEKGIAELCVLHPKYARELEMFNTRWMETRGAVNDEVMAMIRELKEIGYPLYGLSNWSREKFNLVKDELPFLPLLEDYLISADAGVAKPDARIYSILLELIGRKAGECLFIDDSAENINAAHELGFKTIQFQSAEQLRLALRRSGVELP